jgi:ribonuclease III
MLRKMSPYRELERSIGYRFRNRTLLETALLHRSFRFEHPHHNVDNQRLEFLGDAILGMATAAYLYRAYTDKLEGEMTSLRSRVTSGKALAATARTIGLGAFLKMGKGEERSGGRERPSNLADALEAVIGAAWVDGGHRAMDKLFKTLFQPQIASLSGNVLEGNPKGQLQELTQSRWKASPRYRLMGTEGPPHEAMFEVEVELPDKQTFMGRARSKQAAEAASARVALDVIAKPAP